MPGLKAFGGKTGYILNSCARVRLLGWIKNTFAVCVWTMSWFVEMFHRGVAQSSPPV